MDTPPNINLFIRCVGCFLCGISIVKVTEYPQNKALLHSSEWSGNVEGYWKYEIETGRGVLLKKRWIHMCVCMSIFKVTGIKFLNADKECIYLQECRDYSFSLPWISLNIYRFAYPVFWKQQQSVPSSRTKPVTIPAIVPSHLFPKNVTERETVPNTFNHTLNFPATLMINLPQGLAYVVTWWLVCLNDPNNFARGGTSP